MNFFNNKTKYYDFKKKWQYKKSIILMMVLRNFIAFNF